MSTYAERLKVAMELAGYKGRDARSRLSARLKEVQECTLSVQAIGQVLNSPTRAFSAEVSARVARLLRVDHFWLATGEGEPRPGGLSEDAVAFARRYDKLDEEGRRKFSAAIILARPGAPDAVVEKKMPITTTKPNSEKTS